MFEKIKSIGLILLGLSLIAISVLIFLEPERNLATTTGTIVNIVERLESTGDSDHMEYTVYIDYEVDGESFTNVIYPGYTTGMKVGSEVTVIYDVNDVSYIETPNSGSVKYVFLGVGTVISMVGLIMLINSKKA